MKNFNPDKELNKIQKHNKNKILYGIIVLLIIISISSTYALYQVRHSKRIIYTTVDDFKNNKDITLAVYLDNKLVEDFPKREENYVYDKVICDNNENEYVKAYWNYDEWALDLETSKKVKCNVYFKIGTDRSGANPPELYQGLIPVTIEEDGTIKVADMSTEWYNYDEHKWANAVLINDEESHSKYYNADGSFKQGTIMDLENDIVQMYVWIPRYKYKLWNAVNGQVSQPQMINIKFERLTQSTGTTKCAIANNGVETCENALNGNWYTHPAFTFGGTELPGFWFGKFESSGDATNLTIKPDKTAFNLVNFNTS